jgi:flagellar basal-body rod modification protein FlgD
MAISSVSGNNGSSSQAVYDAINQRADAKTSSNAVSDAQDRFLRLLTTQLKNQDPLNPMDNAQMTSQLAQISTVDGIERLNAALQTMLNSTTDSQAMQAATLVGHGVLVPGSGMELASGQAYAGFELGGPADKLTVTIKDANGLVVRTLDLGSAEAGIKAFAWDGLSDNGTPAVDGMYRFSLAATQGKDTVNATALEAGMVTSVLRSGKGISLNVGALGTFSMSDVRQVM